jgi:hypothetical protein
MPPLLEAHSKRVRTGMLKKLKPQPWIAKLLHPRNGLKAFSGVLLLIYALIPACIYTFFNPELIFLKLSLLSCLAIAAMWLGSLIPLFDSRFKTGAARLELNSNFFHTVTWVIFFVFVTVTFLTAPSIPLISAIQGATADTLSQERGDFLKIRVGAEMALLYISTILTNTIIPYSIVLLYASNSKFRHFLAVSFFIFCISFLAKALFLNLVLPLLAYLAIVNKLNKKAVTIGVLGSILILFFGTALSLGNGDDASFDFTTTVAEYISATYVPTNPLDYFAWRAFAVPIYTATDTLLVHAQQFGDQPLMGATSSLLSAIFDLERINLERYVFEYQFGEWNEAANANAVFIVDAYANFGYAGVIIFSLFVGQIFRLFRLSSDVGFKSLWPLFAFVLFNASLIGMLLSNGFLYMLFHALFFSVASNRKSHD